MTRAHNPVMGVDLLVGLGGIVVLVGLGFDWSAGISGYGSLSVLKLLLLLIGVLAVLEPIVLFVTRQTDLPVVWEALLLLTGTTFSLILIGKAVLPPDPGFDTGFFSVLLGMLVITAGSWVTVSREK